jgi:hypothetical protein
MYITYKNIRSLVHTSKEIMARTKTKPGPKPKYGEREEIHVLVPVDDLSYIRSVTNNMTGWIIQAIQEKRQRESEAQPSAAARSYRNFLSKSYGPVDRKRIALAAEEALKNDQGFAANNDTANELAVQRNMTNGRFIQEYMTATGASRREATDALSRIEQSYGVPMGSDAMRLTAYKAAMRSSTSYKGDTPGELNASLQRLVQDSGDMVRDGLVSADEANSAIKFKTSFIEHTKP